MARGATPNRKKTRGKASGNSRNRRKAQASEGLLNEIVLIAVIAFSVLLLMSSLGFAGNLGEFISGILYGVFGIVSFVVPFSIVIFTVFYIKDKGNSVSAVKIWAGILILLALCAFAQLFQFPHEESVSSFGEYYVKSQGLKKGGGIIGGFISSMLDKGLGRAGTYIVLTVLVLIAGILITEKSFLSGVKRGGRTLIDNARNDINRAKVRHEEERPIREENKRLRIEEQKLRRQKEEEVRRQKVKERDERLRQRDLERLKRRQEDERIREENLRKKKEGSLRVDRKISGVMLDPKLTPVEEKAIINDDIHELSYNTSPNGNDPSVKPASYNDEDIYEIRPDNTINEHRLKYENARSEHTIYVEADRIADTVEDEYVKPAVIVKEARYEHEVKKAPVKPAQTRRVRNSEFKFPPINLLKKGSSGSRGDSKSVLDRKAEQLKETLREFGVSVTMTGYTQGPAITRFEMKPDIGVKVSKVLGLSDDIMLSMAAKNVRIEAPIPGKSLIGIELPNEENTAVMLRDLIESQEFKKSESRLSFAVGKGLSGETVVADIGKMPHMLIAGATGSGKSVCINTLIMSILYKARPDEVKLIMIDPKVVELSVYNGIPHLMIPVVTDPKQAAEALKWGVAEMDDRYNRFAEFSVRDLNGYNRKVQSMTDVPEGDRYKVLPRIVIIVDELADLMMVASKEVEESICRIAQKARAAGIHLVIATQRPSVDVVTGLIKANMPSRIAFSVSSGVDSRTILDMVGAEKLLGKGDMLFYPQGYTKPARVQGAFVSDQEVNNVVDFLKDHSGQEGYDEEIAEKIKNASVSSGQASDNSFNSSSGNGRDELFVEAAKAIIDKNKASIGMLQRLFKIGFNRAARIMDQLAEAGVVGEEEGTKPRKVLMSMEQLEAYIEEYI